MISKEFGTTYFMTSITGKRTIQKCKKCDWSVERDFCDKNSVAVHKPNLLDPELNVVFTSPHIE